MLLLSAIASADARAAAHADEQDLHVQYASLLMQQGTAGPAAEAAFPCGTPDALKLDLPVHAQAQAKTVWTMRPPSAHCARLQDSTGNRI